MIILSRWESASFLHQPSSSGLVGSGLPGWQLLQCDADAGGGDADADDVKATPMQCNGDKERHQVLPKFLKFISIGDP